MKAFHGAEILNENFIDILTNYTDCFHYLDSPYFLTTDYNIPFQDEEHKKMLDILRNAEFKWLFSMQYKELCEDGNGGGFRGKMKGAAGRRKNQNAGHPIIRTYMDYYSGFVEPFDTKNIGGKPYYKADYRNVAESNLFALLFPKSKTWEMMICNFDVRRVFPYDDTKNADVVVVPFLEFMKFVSPSTNSGKFPDYSVIVRRALKYREDDIIKNYAAGERV
jgi:hypothetical protein